MTFVVIMAGGDGKRFWPKTRMANPKPLLRIMGGSSLLEQTVARASTLVPDNNIYLSTNLPYRDNVLEEIPSQLRQNMICEPVVRDTGPATGLVAIRLARRDPNAVMVVMPTDHLITDMVGFVRTMRTAIRVAEDSDQLVTVGVRPSRPDTGYGYVECERLLYSDSGIQVYESKKFVEKPEEKKAQKYLDKGDYRWNTGIFAWRVRGFLEAYQKYMPDVYQQLLALDEQNGWDDPNQLASAYEELPKVSIDYGLLEKVKKFMVVEGSFAWDDLGGWRAYERVLNPDQDGNRVVGKMVAIDTENCIVSGDRRLVAVLGVRNLVIVETDDVLLVCDRERVSDIKNLVNRVRDAGLKDYL